MANIIGTLDADSLTGTAGNDSIAGSDGNDTLVGGGGQDSIRAGLGNDVILSGASFGPIDGGGGIDLWWADFRPLSSFLLTQSGKTFTFPGGNAAIDIERFHISLPAGSTANFGVVQAWSPTGSQGSTGAGSYLFFDPVGGGGTLILDWSSLTANAKMNANGWNEAVTPSSVYVAEMLVSNASKVTLLAGSGADTIDGSSGDDSLSGGAGNDRIYGQGGQDTVDGGAGTDYWYSDFSTMPAQTLVQTGSSFVFSGGARGTGIEQIGAVLAAGSSVSLGVVTDSFVQFRGAGGALALDWSSLTIGAVMAGGSGGNNRAERSDGSFAARLDTFTSRITESTLLGGSGSDDIWGSAGNDRLIGNDGNDAIQYGAGFGGGQDTVEGGAGNDVLAVYGIDANTVQGGAGTDTWEIYAPNAVAQTLTQTATGFRLSGGGEAQDVELVQATLAEGSTAHLGLLSYVDQVGRASITFAGLGGTLHLDWSSLDLGADIRIGDISRVPVLQERSPGDWRETFLYALDTAGVRTATILTGSGDDFIRGAAGDEVVTGGGGSDTISGGAGQDVAVYAGPRDRYLVARNGVTGEITVQDTEAAGDGRDRLFSDVETLRFSDGDVATSTLPISASVSIQPLSAEKVEGNSGTTDFTFTVTRTFDTTLAQSVSWAVQGNAEPADADDFGGAFPTGTVDFAVGETSKIIIVTVTGDTLFEPDEGLYVRLFSPTNGMLIGTDAAEGTILNDDAEPRLLEGGTGNDSLRGGAAADTLVGGAGADTLDGGAGADSLVGGNGDDVFIVDHPDDVVVELATGKVDTVRTTLAAFTIMENVENVVFTGVGAFAGTGNAGRNSLTGGSDADTLNGLAGTDTMTGGAGNDLYTVDSSGDRVVELAGGGLDTVQTALTTHTLAAHVESLVFTGTRAFTGNGNAEDNAIIGGGAADRLTGNDGADTLDGRTGADRLVGGRGDDVYMVDNVRDVVVEAANGGTDTVRTTLSAFALRPDVETLIYTGTRSFAGTGSAAANRILGGAGADTLDGGDGADTLAGGAGNDTYIVDTVADVLVEASGGGTDTVRTALATFTLPTEVEGLVFTGRGAFVGIGNAAGNIITGGLGADSLSGEAGADTMIGGAGDDGYLVDNAGDVIVEAAGGGVDGVASLVSYTLGAQIESLVLLAPGRGTGNAIANRMLGSDGADTLEGLDGADTLDGGLGADRLVGGTGDDLYLVDHAGDSVREVAEGGIDTVRTTRSNLTLANHVEHLVFLGAGPLVGSGNASANSILGNAGADTLRGGDGADTLIGGAGADSLSGDAGDDVYIVDDAGDLVREARNGGADTVRTTLNSFALPTEVEALVFTGTGAFLGTGNASRNALSGGSAADTLDGGAGADTLRGGSGSDLYRVDDAGDVVVEAAGGGADSVAASVSHTLGAEIEVLALTAGGRGTGNALDNTLLGSRFADTLSGLDGVDVLEGGEGNDRLNGGAGADRLAGDDGADTLDGGVGADRMVGGFGDDLYLVDDVGDVISEAGAGGYDEVQASVSHTLAAGLDVLRLLGGALDGTGNDGDNVLLGTRANNTLRGLRGADSLFGDLGADTLLGDIGADTLDGGKGSADRLLGGANDDVYIIDDGLDVVVELAGEGTRDRVLATVSLTLAAEVEMLTLLGAANLSGTGNASDNVLTGNAGRNLLTGLGGADTLNGGAGADTLRGDDGNDALDGGAGADTLVGGAGNDTFVIGPDSGADLIVDYGQGRDFLRLVGTGFSTVAEVRENIQMGEAGLFTLDCGPLLGVNVVSFAGFASVEALLDTLIVRFGVGAEVVALGETYATDEDSGLVVDAAQGLLANDSAADGGLAIARTGQFTSAQGGTVAIEADGSFTYFPGPQDFFGTDSFTYLVRDADGSVAEATATINVASVTDGLELVGLAAFDVTSDGTVSFAVLATRGDATAATLRTEWNDTFGVEVDTLPLPAFVPGDAILPYAFSYRFAEPGEFSATIELFDGGNLTASSSFWTKVAGDGATVLTGDQYIDVLIGGAGADTLIGDVGFDALHGAAGADLFVFTEFDFGSDLGYARFDGDNQIDDFQVGTDKISLSGFGADLDSFADVLAHARNVSSILGGSGVAIALNNAETANYVTIFLKDVSKAQLVESDFVFG